MKPQRVWIRAEVRTKFRSKPFTVAIRTADGRERLVSPPLRDVLKFKRYPDGCYAVVDGKRRGPCGNSKRTALKRFRSSGLIASARSGR